MGEHFVEMKR